MCIAGHRIGVIHVATWVQQGMSAQEIADFYSLSLAEVYAALAYYYDHQTEIDAQAAADDARIAAFADNDTSSLATDVRAAWQARLAKLQKA